MKTLLAGGLVVLLSACAPSSTTVAMSWGPGPWYHYCTWDSPCWYSDKTVFVYGWGYFDHSQYVVLYDHPERREGWAYRRREWYPEHRPVYRGRDWNEYKRTQDAKHHEEKKQHERDDHHRWDDHEH